MTSGVNGCHSRQHTRTYQLLLRRHRGDLQPNRPSTGFSGPSPDDTNHVAVTMLTCKALKHDQIARKTSTAVRTDLDLQGLLQIPLPGQGRGRSETPCNWFANQKLAARSPGCRPSWQESTAGHVLLKKAGGVGACYWSDFWVPFRLSIVKDHFQDKNTRQEVLPSFE